MRVNHVSLTELEVFYEQSDDDVHVCAHILSAVSLVCVFTVCICMNIFSVKLLFCLILLATMVVVLTVVISL